MALNFSQLPCLQSLFQVILWKQIISVYCSIVVCQNFEVGGVGLNRLPLLAMSSIRNLSKLVQMNMSLKLCHCIFRLGEFERRSVSVEKFKDSVEAIDKTVSVIKYNPLLDASTHNFDLFVIILTSERKLLQTFLDVVPASSACSFMFCC